MYVCHCEAINDRTVDEAIAGGARTVDEITARCQAGGGCGGCHDMLQTLIDAASAVEEAAASVVGEAGVAA